MEFAILLPLIVLLLAGVIEFGFMFFNKAVITNATREGARAGITGVGDSEIETIVKSYCNQNLINLGGTNEFDPDDPDDDLSISADADNDLTVRVEYGYDFLLGSILGFSMTKIVGQTVMRME